MFGEIITDENGNPILNEDGTKKAKPHDVYTMKQAIEEHLLREQLGPLAEALNMSYIARTYFGKSRSWLSQRLNGSVVNGKRASMTDEEKATLTSALQDIQSQISAFTRPA